MCKATNQIFQIPSAVDALADLFFLIGWVTHHNGWLADLNGQPLS